MYFLFRQFIPVVTFGLLLLLPSCSEEARPVETREFNDSLIYNPRVSSSRDTSWAYLERGRIDSAVFHALRRIERAEQNDMPKEFLVDGYQHLSKVLLSAGVYDLYRTYNIKSQKLYQEYFGSQPGSYRKLFITNMATSYLTQNDFKNAIKYYRQAQNASLEIGDHAAVSGALNNIGIAYLRQQKLDSAKFYFLEAKEYYEENQKSFDGIILAIRNNLGDVHYQFGEYDQSNEFYLSNYELVQTMPDFRFYEKRIVTSNIGMARNALALENLFKANEPLQEAKKYLPRVAYHDRLKLGKELLQLRLKESYLKNDLNTYQKLFAENEQLTDSINNQETAVATLAKEKMAELQIEMAALKIAAKDRELLIAKREKRNTWLLSILVISIFLISGAFLLALTSRRRKQFTVERELAMAHLKNKELEEEKLKLEIQHQGRDLSELSAHAMMLRKLATEAKDTLKSLRQLPVEDQKTEIHDLATRLTQHISSDKVKQVIQANLADVNSAFLDRLDHAAHGQLGRNEKELCALFRLNLSDDQVAELRGISPVGIRVARSRIRKKLGLTKSDDLALFLARLPEGENKSPT